MFTDWLKISAKLSNCNYETKNFSCPECSCRKIKFAYVGNPITQVGYLSIWCENCNKGIQISRVDIPRDVDMIEFGDWKKLESVVPNFEHIIPNA